MPPTHPVIYYARCPVPTASGIAYQRGMFDEHFAGSGTAVRNVRELGPEHANAHFTHALDSFIREGGCTPPIWARSRGAETRLLGVTFMPEPQHVYVRTDDALATIHDLAGRRVALPSWPQLVFDFWRVAAHKGILSALDAHDMTPYDVRLVDVREDRDPHRRLNPGRNVVLSADDESEYGCQLDALLASEVDAFFAKGAEAAVVVRQARGRNRPLYDVNDSANVSHHVNNSTPRLLTCSAALLRDNPQAVRIYMRAILDASIWARQNTGELRTFVAQECAITTDEIGLHFPAGYEAQFMPSLDERRVEHVRTMQRFMLEHGYIANDFSLADWIDPAPLQDLPDRQAATGPRDPSPGNR